MLEETLAIHSVLVNIFLGFLVGGFVVPFMTSNNALGFKKSSLIYTFTFQAIATMIAFSGIIAMFLGELSMSPTIIVMFVVWAIMMYIEIKKYKVIKVANLDNSDTFKLLKSAFLKISLVQTLLVVVMIVLMLLKAQGAISL